MIRRAKARLSKVRDYFRIRKPVVFRNREGEEEFNFTLKHKDRPHGVTAMMRVKNEERMIEASVSSALAAFSDVVLIDNGSTDRTLERVDAIANRPENKGRVKVYKYPFSVARCGEEHNSTPEDSVRSLAYYYNFCRSKCTHTFFIKWDADMVFRKDRLQEFKDSIQELIGRRPLLAKTPCQTLYVAPDGELLVSKEEVHAEPRLAPNLPPVHYVKAKHFERLVWKIRLHKRKVKQVAILELKDTSQDEFSHWTGTDFPSKRKKLEWQNYNAVLEGTEDKSQFEGLPDEAVPDQMLNRD